MKRSQALIAFGFIGLLAACQTTGRIPREVPPEVWERIPADTPTEEIRQGPDGCFWYLRHGPLETVLVPVRDIESVPICT